jgi:hypothetical protein
MVSSTLSSFSFSFSPLIFVPLTKVPIFVLRSSIVRADRLARLRESPSETFPTVMVKCFLETVLCEMTS